MRFNRRSSRSIVLAMPITTRLLWGLVGQSKRLYKTVCFRVTRWSNSSTKSTMVCSLRLLTPLKRASNNLAADSCQEHFIPTLLISNQKPLKSTTNGNHPPSATTPNPFQPACTCAQRFPLIFSHKTAQLLNRNLNKARFKILHLPV
jgi:hypothetical protein